MANQIKKPMGTMQASSVIPRTAVPEYPIEADDKAAKEGYNYLHAARPDRDNPYEKPLAEASKAKNEAVHSYLGKMDAAEQGADPQRPVPAELQPEVYPLPPVPNPRQQLMDKAISRSDFLGYGYEHMPMLMSAPARAQGGPVAAGAPAVVGENGPEVIVPATDSTVVPNTEVAPRALPGPLTQAPDFMPARTGRVFGNQAPQALPSMRQAQPMDMSPEQLSQVQVKPAQMVAGGPEELSNMQVTPGYERRAAAHHQSPLSSMSPEQLSQVQVQPSAKQEQAQLMEKSPEQLSQVPVVAREEGGPVDEGQPALVGEAGPEEVVPEAQPSAEGAPATMSGKPRMKPLGGGSAEPAPEPPKPLSPTDPLKIAADHHEKHAGEVAAQRDQIHADKKEAATMSGGPALMKLGLAKIHENELDSHEAKRHVLNAATDIPTPLVNGTAADSARFVAGLPGTASPEQRTAAAGVAPPLTSGRTAQGAGLGSMQANPEVVAPAPTAPAATPRSTQDAGLGSMQAPPTPAAPTASTEHASLEQRRAALKEQMLSPDLQESGQARRQLAELDRQNPYGSAGNHPGILGKIEHGLAKAGNIAGNVFAPGTMALIPGTDMNMQRERAEGEAEEKQGAAENVAAAGKTAAADADRAKTITTAKGIMQWNPATNRYDIPAGQAVDKEGASKTIQTDQGIMQWNPDTNRYDIPAGGAPPAKATPESVSQATMGKVYSKHPFDPTKPESVNAAMDAAASDKTITPEEMSSEKAYQLNKGDKATQVNIAQNTEQRKADTKLYGETHTYTDATGTHMVSGDKVPEGAESTKVKDPETFMREAEAGNIVQESMNRIWKDVDEHPEVFDNEVSRGILATTLDQVDRTSAGLLIAGTGGQIPLPSGLGDMINTHLQNKTLDKPTADALKQYIADYKAMKDKAIVQQMEMQGGKIGRGSQQAFKAITDQIPNGATPDSKTAHRQMENLQQTQTDLMGKYPDKHDAYTKAKPYERKAAGAGSAGGAPAGATHAYRDAQGNVKGYAVNGVYQPVK